MKKKLIGIFLTATVVMTSMVALGGCKKDPKPTSTKPNNQFTGTKIYKATNGKVKTLNPHTYQLGPESDMFQYIYEGLITTICNEKGDGYQFFPVLAKEMPKISEDKKTYTFTLRDNLKFSDGTPINMDTFIYSYKMLLDPKLKNYRANTCFSTITVKNAKQYFEGKAKWEDVGIKAIDKNTLQFELEYAILETDALISLSYSALVHPGLYDKFMNADKTETKYGTSLESTPSFGAYVLKEWVPDQYYVVEKNKDSALVNVYTPDKIEMRVVEEPATVFQLFEKGEIDYANVPQPNLDRYAEDPRLVYEEDGGVLQLNINMTSKAQPVLTDVNFRKALFYAIDRQKIAKDIGKTHKPAAYVMGSPMTIKPGVTYRGTNEAKAIIPKDNGKDDKLALELFNKAYEANGNKKISIELQYGDTGEQNKLRSEFLKNSLETLFGKDKFELKLKAVPWQVGNDNMKKGDYDLGFMLWGGGNPFNPWSKMQVYTSDYGSKSDQFKNKEFDELYKRTTKGDLLFKDKEKLDALVKMEKLILDEVPFIPILEYRVPVMISDKIKTKTDGKYVTGVGFAIIQSEFTR